MLNRMWMFPWKFRVWSKHFNSSELRWFQHNLSEYLGLLFHFILFFPSLHYFVVKFSGFFLFVCYLLWFLQLNTHSQARICWRESASEKAKRLKIWFLFLLRRATKNKLLIHLKICCECAAVLHAPPKCC